MLSFVELREKTAKLASGEKVVFAGSGATSNLKRFIIINYSN